MLDLANKLKCSRVEAIGWLAEFALFVAETSPIKGKVEDLERVSRVLEKPGVGEALSSIGVIERGKAVTYQAEVGYHHELQENRRAADRERKALKAAERKAEDARLRKAALAHTGIRQEFRENSSGIPAVPTNRPTDRPTDLLSTKKKGIPAASSDGPPKRPRKKPDKPGWTSEAIDDWDRRFGGCTCQGAIGKHLKPLIDKYGWETVRPVWREYLNQDDDAKFVSPANFAGKYLHWAGKSPKPESKIRDLSNYDPAEASKKARADSERRFGKAKP